MAISRTSCDSGHAPIELHGRSMGVFYFHTILVRAVDGEPTAWLSELLGYRDLIKKCIEELSYIAI